MAVRTIDESRVRLPGARSTSRPRRGWRARSRALLGPWPLWRIGIIGAITAGVAVMCYPAAAIWFDDRVQAGQASGYGEKTGSAGAADLAAELEAAREYNRSLPNGPLRDPYALDDSGRPRSVGNGEPAYEATLNSDPNGIMALLRIPKIRVNLPIFHHTDPEVLDIGVGHLFGSGLPVGGEDTHSVLTAHSGMVGARLFNDLHHLRTGDRFYVSVAGETLAYEVDQRLTVLPTQLDALRQVPGEDYITLVTCTPIGVNTHRLLVRGTRVPMTKADEARLEAVTEEGPGFPWWVLPVPAAVLLLALATRPLARAHSAHRRPDVARTGADRPMIRIAYRAPHSAELAAWREHRRRALPRASRWPSSVGAFTWTLFLGDQRLGVSAEARSTPDAVFAEIARLPQLSLVLGLRSSRKRGTLWLIGAHGSDGSVAPLLMGLTPESFPGVADLRGREAVDLLHRAELPFGASPVPPPVAPAAAPVAPVAAPLRDPGFEAPGLAPRAEVRRESVPGSDGTRIPGDALENGDALAHGDAMTFSEAMTLFDETSYRDARPPVAREAVLQ
ncbi:class C sortase [Leucobacter triazinivorans]|uniref:Class C sortase n=1 Tax=Leucobacter triazinivorans TaxID=1784719 RepID=A0A4P6KDL6_9MICO|nr:class C sortase [Leucobacter triazinivorans]QBE48407.1 class C sortase [Leucobacter triazinivorans]